MAIAYKIVWLLRTLHELKQAFMCLCDNEKFETSEFWLQLKKDQRDK